MFVILTFSISACKSTPAKEEENWQRNIIEMNESIKIYPNLKGALVANRTQATEMWKKAKAMSNDKTRLAAMKNANSVMRQVVGPLRRIETQLETVERDLNRLSQRRMTGSAVIQREQVLGSLRRDLDATRQALYSVSFQDPMQAKIYLDKQYARSNGLRNRSRSIRKRLTKRKRNQVRRNRQRNTTGKSRPGTSPAQRSRPRVMKTTTKSTSRIVTPRSTPRSTTRTRTRTRTRTQSKKR